METREQFMDRCITRMRASGKTDEQANRYCEIAWNRLITLEEPKSRTRKLLQKAEYVRDIREDGISFTDAIILAGLAYMWLGDSDEGSRGNYDHYNAPIVDSDSSYGSSSSDTSKSDDRYSSPVVTTDSDYGSSSRDYSDSSSSYSSSNDYSSSSSSDYSSSSSDYSSSSSYDSGGSFSSSD